MHLNSESTLTYDENFSTGRVVKVDGEAFFKIRKDSLRPFTIRANHLSATVLGTSFNVRTRAGKNDTEISLITGELLVADTLNKNSVILQPRQAANSGIPGQQIVKTHFDTDEITYWTRGIIYFINR